MLAFAAAPAVPWPGAGGSDARKPLFLLVLACLALLPNMLLGKTPLIINDLLALWAIARTMSLSSRERLRLTVYCLLWRNINDLCYLVPGPLAQGV